MLTCESRSKTHPDVICTELPDGEAVLLHVGTKRYFTLNQTGARIWNLIQQGETLGAIARGLESDYDVSQELARESVLELVGSLYDEQLLVVEP